jgi:hypothetical protein
VLAEHGLQNTALSLYYSIESEYLTANSAQERGNQYYAQEIRKRASSSKDCYNFIKARMIEGNL